jgi:hypothetical protein
MAKNLERYLETWKLRKEGKTLKEIGKVMGFSAERARTVINYVDFVIKNKIRDYKIFTSMLRKSS